MTANNKRAKAFAQALSLILMSTGFSNGSATFFADAIAGSIRLVLISPFFDDDDSLVIQIDVDDTSDLKKDILALQDILSKKEGQYWQTRAIDLKDYLTDGIEQLEMLNTMDISTMPFERLAYEFRESCRTSHHDAILRTLLETATSAPNRAE